MRKFAFALSLNMVVALGLSAVASADTLHAAFRGADGLASRVGGVYVGPSQFQMAPEFVSIQRGDYGFGVWINDSMSANIEPLTSAEMGFARSGDEPDSSQFSLGGAHAKVAGLAGLKTLPPTHNTPSFGVHPDALVVPKPAPEPTSLALVGMGLVAAALVRRRRNASNQQK